MCAPRCYIICGATGCLTSVVEVLTLLDPVLSIVAMHGGWLICLEKGTLFAGIQISCCLTLLVKCDTYPGTGHMVLAASCKFR